LLQLLRHRLLQTAGAQIWLVVLHGRQSNTHNSINAQTNPQTDEWHVHLVPACGSA
jgi:hypothetical protein